MPHLAPLSWISAFLLFWLLISLVMAIIWWVQLPSFPLSSSQREKLPFSIWKWN